MKSDFIGQKGVENRIVEADDAILDRCLSAAERYLVSDSIGYFGPGSVAWQVFREPVILLGGYRAIMLQVAHPAVAQGIELSSSFRNDVIGRARRTIQAMNGLIFGSKDQAQKAARTMHTIHHRVKGVVPEGLDSPWSGQPFRANDLDLKNWVGLTTIDTVIGYFEKFVRPFSSAERIQLAKEVQIIALLCGLPEEYHRESLEELSVLRDKILAGEELAVGNIATGIVDDLFDVAPGSLDQRITYGMLPPAIRELYQIPWRDQDQKDYDRLAKRISFLNRSLPKAIRYIPAWTQAQARIALEDQTPDEIQNSGRRSFFKKGKEQSAALYLRLFGADIEA